MSSKNHQIGSERLTKKQILDKIKEANQDQFTLNVVETDQINSYFEDSTTDQTIRCAGQWSVCKILHDVSKKYRRKPFLKGVAHKTVLGGYFRIGAF